MHHPYRLSALLLQHDPLVPRQEIQQGQSRDQVARLQQCQGLARGHRAEPTVMFASQT